MSIKHSGSRWAARRAKDSTTLAESVCDIKLLCLERAVARTPDKTINAMFLIEVPSVKYRELASKEAGESSASIRG